MRYLLNDGTSWLQLYTGIILVGSGIKIHTKEGGLFPGLNLSETEIWFAYIRLIVLDLADFSGLVVKPSVLVVSLAASAVGPDRSLGGPSQGLLVLQVELEQLGEGDGSENADAGRERQHETHHDAGEVDGADGVQDDEDALVVDVLDAVPEADGKDAGQDVQVEEEGEPGGRLVLADTGNDRDVDLCVAGVPQRIEPEKQMALFRPT